MNEKNRYDSGQLYIISNPKVKDNIGYYKLGFTSNWNQRQKSYRTSIPEF